MIWNTLLLCIVVTLKMFVTMKLSWLHLQLYFSEGQIYQLHAIRKHITCLSFHIFSYKMGLSMISLQSWKYWFMEHICYEMEVYFTKCYYFKFCLCLFMGWGVGIVVTCFHVHIETIKFSQLLYSIYFVYLKHVWMYFLLNYLHGYELYTLIHFSALFWNIGNVLLIRAI